MRLNRAEAAVGGRHCSVIGGALVRDDLLTALDLFDLWAGDAPPAERAERTLALLFPEGCGDDPRGAARTAVGLLWDLFGLDVSGEHAGECGGERAFDWDHDADAVRATLLSQYGVTVAELAERFSYMDAVALVGMSAHETPMGQLIYYRTRPEPEPTPYNAEEVEEFRRRREALALPAELGGRDPYEEMNDRINAALEG